MAKPYRSKKYLEWIRQRNCLIKGWGSSIAHHVRMGAGAGMGQKPSDYWTLPLSTDEHHKLHHMGEKAYWQEQGYEPHEDIGRCLLGYITGRGMVREAIRALEDIAHKLDKED